jgi:hypothetical protein
MTFHYILQTPAFEQVKLSLRCHDGTGDFRIVDVPKDISMYYGLFKMPWNFEEWSET